MTNRIAEQLEQMEREAFFQLALPALSDSSFLSGLEKCRGKGRNDYPIELLWKGLLASIAYKVPTIEAMRRKMLQAPALFTKVPSSFSFSRFFSSLCRFSMEIEALTLRNLERAPFNFGSVIAIGNLDEIYFLWEAESGLPLLFQMKKPEETPSAIAEKLLERAKSLNAPFFQRCKYLIGDSTYEDLIKIVWERYRVRALIPLKGSSAAIHPYREAYYDDQGMVYCHLEDRRAMIYAGFEESRNTLKYRCMARHYGTRCDHSSCPLRSGIRIPISIDPRLFTPLPRTSYRWSHLYRLYDSLEQVKGMLQSYLYLANNEPKKNLCCQIAALLLHAGAAALNRESKKSEKIS
jgi:hypothetical protein